MPDKILVSVDAGNGGTNVVMQKGTTVKMHYEPSIRAAATGDTLGMGDMEMAVNWIDWNGHRYVSGDDCLKITRRGLERHMGSNRYANEFQQFLIAVGLARLGVTEGEIDLTVFAPPGMYKEVKPDIIARLKGTEATIKLAGDKKPRIWTYSNVTVWPEGIGAAACFMLDDKGELFASDVLTGDVVVIDPGAHTTDHELLTDGNLNPEALVSASYEKQGVHVHVREPILRLLKKKSEDFANLTVDDVDLAIRRGTVTGDYTITAGRFTADIKDLVDRYSERFAEWIANTIIDGVYDGLRGIRLLILVGGGAVLVVPYLRKWYGDKVFDHKKHPTTKKLHPVDMNAIGGLRLAKFAAAKAKR